MKWRSQQPLTSPKLHLRSSFLLDKPSPDTPLRREKQKIHLNLALLVYENITLNLQLQNPPAAVNLSPEPYYEGTLNGSSALSEPEKQAPTTQDDLEKHVSKTTQDVSKSDRSKNILRGYFEP